MNMSALKSVVIAFPKGLSKGSATIMPGNELIRSVPKLNFSTSLLTDKTTEMDITRKIPKQEELHEDNGFFKPDVCIRGKKRRLDHLTWEEKLQRKYVCSCALY